MRLADPRRSAAVLVGSAHYQDAALEDIPAVAANVEDLAAILADPALGGFRPETIHTIVDPDARSGREIARWCRTAEDVLVVYFSGHGLVDNRGQLLLALSDTEEDLRDQSSLPIEQLRSAIHDSPARIRILIIDCCYSGRALAETMSDDGSRLLGQIDVQGTYALASAPKNLVSLFVPGERHTVFSGELIALLREGVAEEGPLLALSTVYHHLTRRLRARDSPTPKVLHTDTVSEFALVHNRGHRPGDPEPAEVSALRTPAEADELVRRLTVRAPAFDELSAAALDPAWPILARLRFAWVLADRGETERAAAALYALGAGYHKDLVRNVSSLVAGLVDDVEVTDLLRQDWDIDGLIPRQHYTGEAYSRDLWGTAMAALLATARLPTSVRVQAVTELAGLGHRDEAARIARGMLRERKGDPSLATALGSVLAA